jgi:hypothetical protein
VGRCHSRGPQAYRAHGSLPRAIVGHAALHKPAAPMLCHWAASRIWAIGLCFVFLFSEYIQNLANFKNLCKFGLKSENVK